MYVAIIYISFVLLAPTVCKHTRSKKNKRCRFRHLTASFAWVEDGIDCATLVFPLRLPRRRYQASLRNKLLRNIFCPPCPIVCKHTGCKKNKRCRFRHLIASFAWVEDGIRTHDLRNHNPLL